MSKTIEPTERSEVRRIPDRGSYDRDTIYSILDEGFVCHVGFTVDNKPFVIPTSYARHGDEIYLHGASVSRMMKTLSTGVDVCVTVTLIDGLVLARSVFHHSMNYRSVVIFGKAKEVTESDEKMKAMRAFTEHIVEGRWDDARIPNEKELNVTTVLRLAIDESSAKIRTGGPVDDAKDYELDFWAGVVPLGLEAGNPIDDEKLGEGIDVPEYLSRQKRFAK